MSAPLGAYYPVATSRADDDSPVDAALSKLIHNNAVWLWEHSGQVRAKTFAANGMGPATALANAWYVLMRIPFPCSLLPTRAPFPFRIRLAGKSGFAGVNTTYRVTVGHGAATPWYLLAGTANVLEATTTSTTLDWLIEDTITPSVADGENGTQQMFTAVEGGSIKSTSVRVPTQYLEVWGKTDNASYPPLVYAVLAEEWPGTTDYFSSGGFSGGGGGGEVVVVP